jgi:methylglutaconyl-CoA hydratase
LRDVLLAIETLPKPTIAVVHGGAVGGGAGFVACCDVAIATEAAFFSVPEVRVGMPPLGVMPFLVRAMGHRNFRRYGLSGERISATDALRIGLVHQVCEAATLEETLARIADDILHGAPRAIAALKEAAAPFASPPLSAILAHRPPHNAKTPEAIEGIASFREKRKPGWYPQ